MYLNNPKLVVSAQRPSFITSGIHVMFGVREVNGAATEASASDKLTPTCDAFNAYNHMKVQFSESFCHAECRK